MARTLIGNVTSDKADKTIVVTVVTRKTHPLYQKKYMSSKKFMAHDENNEASIGDKVSIVATRPLSARKRFMLEKILERPVLRGELAGDIEVPMTEKKPVVKKEVKETPKTKTTAKKEAKADSGDEQ